MRGWSVLIAVVLLFGLAALIVVDDPARDDLWLSPAEPLDPFAPSPGTVAPAAPTPSTAALASAPSLRAPRPSDSERATTSPEPAAVTRPPAATPGVPAATTTSELEALLTAIREAFLIDETAPADLASRLNELLRQNPAAAREALDRLFSMPAGLGRARPLLFQALLATGDDAVIAEMSRRIQESHEAWLSTAPRTREELHAALLFGDAKVRTRALQTLKREHLSDPLVQDYLRTTAGDPTAAWGLRRTAIKALGRTRSPASSALLLGLFTSTAEKRERVAIMRALERHAEFDPAVCATMLPLAYDANRSVAERRFALTGLTRAKPDPNVRDAFLHVLRTAKDVHMRRIAAGGLGAYASEPSVQALLGDHLGKEEDAVVVSTLTRILTPPVN